MMQTKPKPLLLTDTSDMVRLHRVFREAFCAGEKLVGAIATRDKARAELVGSYYANVISLLHCHHEGEDELLTPRLLTRCPEQTATIERVSRQHQQVLAAIHDAETLIGPWQQAPTVQSTAALVSALSELNARLTPHLDHEERDILPIAAVHITAQEWAELPAHGMQHFTGDKMWLILGLVREQMTSGQVAEMDASMPAPVMAFWADRGREMFRDYMAALRA